ncbi:hypothetical protein GW915_10550 [bacterium]|nr:hypothetical protein [bacterium]
MKIKDRNPGVGRREFPSNLNLVPFIDLFSTIIIFLIITAVFDRLATLEINLATENASSITVPTPDLKKIEAVRKVTIRKDSMVLFDSGRVQTIKKESTVNDEGEEVTEFNYELVGQFMAEARQRDPEGKNIVVFSDDKAIYADLVKVLDFALSESFTDLVVTGNQ